MVQVHVPSGVEVRVLSWAPRSNKLLNEVQQNQSLLKVVISIAQMAELVDAHGSGPCAFGCGGSSPLLGTNNTGRRA
jgi:hypothetical protein